MNEKKEVILIRCTKKTKEAWRQLLYQYKAKGWTAEDLLRYLMFSEQPMKGKVY